MDITTDTTATGRFIECWTCGETTFDTTTGRCTDPDCWTCPECGDPTPGQTGLCEHCAGTCSCCD